MSQFLVQECAYLTILCFIIVKIRRNQLILPMHRNYEQQPIDITCFNDLTPKQRELRILLEITNCAYL